MTDVARASSSTGTQSQAIAIRYERHACSPAFSEPDMPQIIKGMIDVMPAMIASNLTQ